MKKKAHSSIIKKQTVFDWLMPIQSIYLAQAHRRGWDDPVLFPWPLVGMLASHTRPRNVAAWLGGVLQWTVISSLRLIRLRYLNYANDFGA